MKCLTSWKETKSPEIWLVSTLGILWVSKEIGVHSALMKSMFNADQEVLPDSMSVLYTHTTSILALGRAEWDLLQKIKSVFRGMSFLHVLSLHPEDLQAPSSAAHRGPGSTANTG